MARKMKTRIKICGITRIEDALAAASAGADAIGLVFYSKSPRAVSIAQAKAICAELPPFITVVALFVDAKHADIDEILRSVPVDVLQFHGNETPDQCDKYGKPYIKAIRMRHDADLLAAVTQFHSAQGVLVDSYHPEEAGGTGETFDWTRVPADLEIPVILAGGLTPENVAMAIKQLHPYAVDVSSGVEKSKGVKDVEKIHAFVTAVNTINDE